MNDAMTPNRAGAARLVGVGMLVGALLLFGCGSDSDDDSGDAAAAEETDTPTETATPAETETPTETETPSETETPDEEPTPEVTGKDTGVTDDSVKIGITHVDTEALRAAGLDLQLGDHRAVYEALIDDVNASGGIAGRQLEAVIEAVDPTNVVSSEELCVKFAEDDEVFLVTGFWLRESVLCPLDVYETAVIGGGMTPERIELAKAPWLTWNADTEQPLAIVEAFAEMGELDGTVAVFGDDSEQAVIESQLLPLLDELGVEVVEVAIGVAPPGDQTAVQSEVLIVAERFEASGADTVLLVGPDDVWLRYMAGQPYDPQLLFTDRIAGSAFATNAETTDTTILEGALLGGTYGPNQAIFDEETMTECVGILEAAGLEIPPPSEFSDEDETNQPYQAAFQACRDIYLLRALFEAAGENLNYGTLELAIEEGFEVTIPGDPIPRTYGPPPSGDGDPTPYFFTWNETEKDFELLDS